MAAVLAALAALAVAFAVLSSFWKHEFYTCRIVLLLSTHRRMARSVTKNATALARDSTIQGWIRKLASLARGLDFKDERDRASFRIKVRTAMQSAEGSDLHALSRHLEIEPIRRRHDAMIRGITTVYMYQHGQPLPKWYAMLAEPPKWCRKLCAAAS